MRHNNTILIVDDAIMYINYLSELLRDYYNIQIAVDGETALEIANGPNPPDLILQDIVLPDMSGYDICRNLKSQHKTKDIPVIFLTSKFEDEDLNKGFSFGGSDYLTKPINCEELLARVNVHLKLVNYIAELKVVTEERNELIRILKTSSKKELENYQSTYNLIKNSELDLIVN